ncbi:hypothetical protein LUZ60_015454 [Juncus effusus]|nr:hypothetical protein LUZ60_015454 [Juncus effusus]
MAVSFPSSEISPDMDRTTQWVFSQDIPTDLLVQVGDSSFPLHKLMMVPKSSYIRRKVHESRDPASILKIDLSDLPGGPEAFEQAAKFCYGVNFEITVYNIAALICVAEYLDMKEENMGEKSLASRADEFLEKAALKTLPGAVAVLSSCKYLMPLAEEIGVVDRCVNTVGLKTCKEVMFPTRSPPDWWASELSSLSPAFFQKVLNVMQVRSTTPKALSTAISTYANLTLLNNTTLTLHHRTHLESIVSLLPQDNTVPLSVNFLCLLLRIAIALSASNATRENLEKRITSLLETVTLNDLLLITLDMSGERIADLDSVRRIISEFVEKESRSNLGGILYGAAPVLCSETLQNVAKVVDAFVGEIATDEEMPISKFVGIAGAFPKSARRFDDDLYRAIDIYLKAHPGLDEIEREKVCSVMDPLKLSYGARLHATQNKRLPLQITLSALYFDQLKLRSTMPGLSGQHEAGLARGQAISDASLARENEALKSELARMKTYVNDLHKGRGSGSSKQIPATDVPAPSKKPKFFASFSKKLGKLNPFRNGSKDTFNLTDEVPADVAVGKPRRRRFSIS